MKILTNRAVLTFSLLMGVTRLLFADHVDWVEAKPLDGCIKKVNGKQLEGWLKTNIGYKIFFVAQFDTEMKEFRGWKNSDLGIVMEVSGHPIVGYPRFEVSANQVIQMKVALSYCSIDQAESNMAIELEHWNFDKVRRESRRQWNELLDNVEVTGGTNDQKKRFCTDVWHTLLGRSTCSDANGKYPDTMGLSLVIRELPKQNIAPLATITTSSELDDAHAAKNVGDGVIGKQSGDWASRGEQNPWIMLSWPTRRTLNRIDIFDPPGGRQCQSGKVVVQ